MKALNVALPRLSCRCFSTKSAQSTQIYLSQIVTGSKIPSRQKSGCYIRSHLRIAISTACDLPSVASATQTLASPASVGPIMLENDRHHEQRRYSRGKFTACPFHNLGSHFESNRCLQAVVPRYPNPDNVPLLRVPQNKFPV